MNKAALIYSDNISPSQLQYLKKMRPMLADAKLSTTLLNYNIRNL